MENKKKFQLTKEKDKYVLHCTDVSVLSESECLKELKKLRTDMLSLDSTILNLETQIKEGAAEKQLAKLQENKEDLISLCSQWEEALKPYREELKKNLRNDIQKLKGTKGYKKSLDAQKKVVLSNQILAEVAVKYEVEMTDSLIAELKAGFDGL